MTYKTGSIGEFMRSTKRVVTDPAAAANTPKRWFDSDETATHALASQVSAEAMVKLLSAENLALLHLIVAHRPELRTRACRALASQGIQSIAYPQEAARSRHCGF